MGPVSHLDKALVLGSQFLLRNKQLLVETAGLGEWAARSPHLLGMVTVGPAFW